jgi:hypothetical protein
VGAIARPPDIGCSMAILSWRGTLFAFGRTMADEFIVVQIVVRNLNPDKEFLVHDAEFAVDADINGRLGRYASGVDKLTARGFMLESRDYSPRGLALHVAQGVGSLLSGVSLVYSSAWKDAANVYSGGFMTALNGVLPDHNTEHLNLLNDEGFSSYRTERTVVPKSGTAEFVIFIPSKQFEEGWWVQDCAHQTIIKKTVNEKDSKTDEKKGVNTDAKKDAKTDGKEEAHCVGQFNSPSPDPRCKAAPNIGVDVAAARLVCLDYYKDNAALHKVDDAEMYYFEPKAVDYKEWSPNALALFRELSLSAIAGTHIQEEKDIKPSLTKVDCPVDDKGDLKFDSAQSGSISCTLTGTNLDKVQKLKLRNAQDATDNKTADAAVSTSGDSKTAKALLQLDQVGPLNAKAYKVYTVTKDGVEDGGTQILHLDLQPFLSEKPDPPEVDLAKLQAKDAQKVTITLKRLSPRQTQRGPS